MEARKIYFPGVLPLIFLSTLTWLPPHAGAVLKKDQELIQKSLAAYFPKELDSTGFTLVKNREELGGKKVFIEEQGTEIQRKWYTVYREVPATPTDHTQHVVYVRYVSWSNHT
jgi:hypothetical protein